MQTCKEFFKTLPQIFEQQCRFHNVENVEVLVYFKTVILELLEFESGVFLAMLSCYILCCWKWNNIFQYNITSWLSNVIPIKMFSKADDKKLPALAILKTDWLYLNGILRRPEQTIIQLEVRICNSGAHSLLRKKVYNF